MSVILKKGHASIRKNGEMVDVNILFGQTSQQLATMSAAANDKIASINEVGDAKVQTINEQGDAVKESIVEDYDTFSNDLNALKSTMVECLTQVKASLDAGDTASASKTIGDTINKLS